jgi:hypothetical protein
MSTAAVSSSSIYQELQAYFQQRGSDQKTLGQALKAGDLAGAQKEFAAIQALGQSGPLANGNAYIRTRRQEDFNAVGQALQAGDLAGAQKAFAELQSTFRKPEVHHQADQNPAVVVNLGGPAAGSSAGSSSGSSAGSTAGSSAGSAPVGQEIVVNLGNVPAGEQITIGVSNTKNGGEQVTIGVSGQPHQAPEQITLNLSQNSNQEIILNLFNSTANSSTAASRLNATA